MSLSKFKDIFAAAGFSLIAAASATASQAPLASVAIESPPAKSDRWQIIVANVNFEVKQPSLLELPTALIISAFKTTSIGFVLADAYSREADRFFRQKMRVPSNPNGYTIVRGSTLVESASGTERHEWSGIGTKEAIFSVNLRRRGFFEGSAWFGGVAVALAQANGSKADDAEADAVFEAALIKIRQQMAKAAAERYAAEQVRDAARASSFDRTLMRRREAL